LWISGFKQKSYYKSQAAKPGTEIEIFAFFSSSGSRRSENLKRFLGTLDGRWLHKIYQIKYNAVNNDEINKLKK
jgi:hypothetical protein